MPLRRQPALIPLIVALVALVALVAIPALAASPSPSPSASGAPGKSGDTPGKGPKQAKEKAPGLPVELSGPVGTRTTTDGEAEYTLTVGSTVYTIDAGPSWYWKDKHPLKAYVGKTVKVVGEQKQGSTEVDVQTVDGKALREPGKPPWAGGWKAVGTDHPGWSQEKADRWAAKLAEKMARFGLDCWPPGHCKDASGKPATPNATPTPAP
jgi:hypothetical protein